MCWWIVGILEFLIPNQKNWILLIINLKKIRFRKVAIRQGVEKTLIIV